MRFSSGGDETPCGIGSKLKYAADAILVIEKVIRERQIKSILDVGCGDANWMRRVFLQGATYHGIDIDENNLSLAKKNMPGSRFTRGDDFGPGYGLIICRHVMQHLPTARANALLRKMLDNSDYALVTHHPGTKANKDTVLGGFRPIALDESPFNIVPLEKYEDDKLELWLCQ